MYLLRRRRTREVNRVIISQGGQQREVTLACVPHVNEHIRLASDELGDPLLIVDDVIYHEGNGTVGPTVVIIVHPHRPAPASH